MRTNVSKGHAAAVFRVEEYVALVSLKGWCVSTKLQGATSRR
jgi:hypothetical protein